MARSKKSPELPLEGPAVNPAPDEAESGPSDPPTHSIPRLDDLIQEVGDDPAHSPVMADNETFIPIHGFVKLSDDELQVVDHPAFQRLGSIYQLGQTHLVYRGATHRRIEHVLGTLYVAQEMIEAVRENYRRSIVKEDRQEGSSLRPARLAKPPTDVETVFIRLAALLHDIGHLPEGHTLEDELGFLDKHDKPGRMSLVLDEVQWPGGEVPSLRSVLDTTFGEWTQGRGITPTELLVQIIAKSPPPEFTPAAEAILRVNVCRDIVGNTICADLLDYLHRDWFHLGKHRYFDQRLFHYMEIREDDKGKPQFVISLGTWPRIRTDAVTAILGLLESRYELAESVLFHRTKCAAAAMLERALFELESAVEVKDRKEWKSRLERDLLFVSDEGVIDFLMAEAVKHKVEAALRPLRALRQRRLYKGVVTTFRQQLPADRLARVQSLYTGSPAAAKARNEAMRAVEDDFSLPVGSLAIYSPDKGMNQKIAAVKIHVNGHVAVFREWDRSNRQELSGGHLQAQLERFDFLWRIHIAIDRVVWAEMSTALQDALRQAIEVCVLGGTAYSGQSFDAATASLATQLTMVEDSPYYGRVLGAREVGARDGTADPAYPPGAPRIRTFFSGDA